MYIIAAAVPMYIIHTYICTGTYTYTASFACSIDADVCPLACVGLAHACPCVGQIYSYSKHYMHAINKSLACRRTYIHSIFIYAYIYIYILHACMHTIKSSCMQRHD